MEKNINFGIKNGFSIPCNIVRAVFAQTIQQTFCSQNRHNTDCNGQTCSQLFFVQFCFILNAKSCSRGAVVVAQLVELPTPEVHNWNVIIGKKLYRMFNVNCIEKTKIKRRPEMAHFREKLIQRILSYFVRERMTVWLTFSLSALVHKHQQQVGLLA